MGTYKTEAGSFIKAYVRHKQQMKETYGIDYESPDEDLLQYLTCQQVYVNNQLVCNLLFRKCFCSILIICIHTTCFFYYDSTILSLDAGKEMEKLFNYIPTQITHAKQDQTKVIIPPTSICQSCK
jgi:hypothetical protein